MITIEASSQEAEVLRYLLDKYPVTVEELRDMLSLPKRTLTRVIRKLEKRRIILLEPLPGKTYIRLQRSDIRFVGINPSQRRALKHRGGGRKKKEEDEGPDPAYL